MSGHPLDADLLELLDGALAAADRAEGPIVFLTGAGISAESGIPTFRGPAGFWRVGSRNYRPEELATFRAFRSMPEGVWAWYLYRFAMCRAAAPNAAHTALAELERVLGARFLLITQNVDGLHPRAGSSAERTYQIHGNLDFVRCAASCSSGLLPMPGEARSWAEGRALDAGMREKLTCPECGDWLRPHVLWFDECYDEARYRFESSMVAAATCSLLVVVGTSGATTLPMRVASLVTGRGAPLVVVDPAPSPFSELAESSPRGRFIAGTAGDVVPAITAAVSRR